MVSEKSRNTLFGIISVISTAIVTLQIVTIVRAGVGVLTPQFVVLGILCSIVALVVTPRWHIGGRDPSV